MEDTMKSSDIYFYKLCDEIDYWKDKSKEWEEKYKELNNDYWKLINDTNKSSRIMTGNLLKVFLNSKPTKDGILINKELTL